MRRSEIPAPGFRPMTLSLLSGDYAVCRLEPEHPVPAWAQSGGEFVSVSRTKRELSIVVAETALPDGVKAECGWRILELEGPIPFSETGVLAGLLNPLAGAGIGIFAVSTYDTDYILVKAADLDRALSVLSDRYRVVTPGRSPI